MDFAVTETFVRSANAAQLHEEARGTKKSWPASFTVVDGQWVYRVDRDDIDPAAVQAALDAHTPDPDFGKTNDDKVVDAFLAKSAPTAKETVDALKAFIRSRK